MWLSCRAFLLLFFAVVKTFRRKAMQRRRELLRLILPDDSSSLKESGWELKQAGGRNHGWLLLDGLHRDSFTEVYKWMYAFQDHLLEEWCLSLQVGLPTLANHQDNPSQRCLQARLIQTQYSTEPPPKGILGFVKFTVNANQDRTHGYSMQSPVPSPAIKNVSRDGRMEEGEEGMTRCLCSTRPRMCSGTSLHMSCVYSGIVLSASPDGTQPQQSFSWESNKYEKQDLAS